MAMDGVEGRGANSTTDTASPQLQPLSIITLDVVAQYSYYYVLTGTQSTI